MKLTPRRVLLSIYSAISVIAVPAFADNYATLTKLPHRPTLLEVKQALGGLPVTPNYHDSLPTVYRERVKLVLADVKSQVPTYIAQAESVYPGATWVFIGRDAALMGNVFESFYLAHGQNRVVYLGASSESIRPSSPEMLIQFLLSHGMPTQLTPETPPFIMLDATFFGPRHDKQTNAFIPQGQSNLLIEAAFKYYISQGYTPGMIIKKINFININQTLRTDVGEPKNATAISPDFNMAEFVKSHLSEKGPDLITTIPAKNLTYSREWHKSFGPLMNFGGRTVAPPGESESEDDKKNILNLMIEIAHITETPEFFQKVKNACQNFGFEFDINRNHKPNFLTAALERNHDDLLVTLEEVFNSKHSLDALFSLSRSEVSFAIDSKKLVEITPQLLKQSNLDTIKKVVWTFARDQYGAFLTSNLSEFNTPEQFISLFDRPTTTQMLTQNEKQKIDQTILDALPQMITVGASVSDMKNLERVGMSLGLHKKTLWQAALPLVHSAQDYLALTAYAQPDASYAHKKLMDQFVKETFMTFLNQHPSAAQLTQLIRQSVTSIETLTTLVEAAPAALATGRDYVDFFNLSDSQARTPEVQAVFDKVIAQSSSAFLSKPDALEVAAAYRSAFNARVPKLLIAATEVHEVKTPREFIEWAEKIISLSNKREGAAIILPQLQKYFIGRNPSPLEVGAMIAAVPSSLETLRLINGVAPQMNFEQIHTFLIDETATESSRAAVAQMSAKQLAQNNPAAAEINALVAQFAGEPQLQHAMITLLLSAVTSPSELQKINLPSALASRVRVSWAVAKRRAEIEKNNRLLNFCEFTMNTLFKSAGAP